MNRRIRHESLILSRWNRTICPNWSETRFCTNVFSQENPSVGNTYRKQQCVVLSPTPRREIKFPSKTGKCKSLALCERKNLEIGLNVSQNPKKDSAKSLEYTTRKWGGTVSWAKLNNIYFWTRTGLAIHTEKTLQNMIVNKALNSKTQTDLSWWLSHHDREFTKLPMAWMKSFSTC